MAYATVASTNASGSGVNTFTTSAIDTTGVDLIIIAISNYKGSGDAAVSDSKSNTYSLARRELGSAIADIAIWYCQAPTVGSGHTFTATGTAFYMAMAVQGFSGSATSPLDQVNSANCGDLTTLATGSITPTQDNELVIAAASITNNSSNYSIDSGFTELNEIDWQSGVKEGLDFGYLVQTSAAAVNPAFSWSKTGTTEASAAVASFKAAAAAVRQGQTIIRQGVNRASTY